MRRVQDTPSMLACHTSPAQTDNWISQNTYIITSVDRLPEDIIASEFSDKSFRSYMNCGDDRLTGEPLIGQIVARFQPVKNNAICYGRFVCDGRMKQASLSVSFVPVWNKLAALWWQSAVVPSFLLENLSFGPTAVNAELETMARSPSHCSKEQNTEWLPCIKVQSCLNYFDSLLFFKLSSLRNEATHHQACSIQCLCSIPSISLSTIFSHAISEPLNAQKNECHLVWITFSLVKAFHSV